MPQRNRNPRRELIRNGLAERRAEVDSLGLDRLGDVVPCVVIDVQTGLPKPPRLPHAAFNHDTEQAIASIRKLAAMEPARRGLRVEPMEFESQVPDPSHVSGFVHSVSLPSPQAVDAATKPKTNQPPDPTH